jgi:hypothetical protein
LYEKAIRLMESADESNPRYVAMALAEYSQVLKKVGRRAEAKAVERRAKAIFADSTALRAHTVDIGSLRGTRAAQ